MRHQNATFHTRPDDPFGRAKKKRARIFVSATLPLCVIFFAAYGAEVDCHGVFTNHGSQLHRSFLYCAGGSYAAVIFIIQFFVASSPAFVVIAQR